VKPASHRFFPRQSGQFTELVERRFADAIKHLEATKNPAYEKPKDLTEIDSG
jgi:hypothetical protein